MSHEIDSTARRIPSLVHYCQRVASNHVDWISSFGDDLRYELIEPILESCSVEILVRLEEASPHIQDDAQEVWRNLCFRKYPIASTRYISEEIEDPDSWREQFFIMREMEAKRLEEVGSKIRTQRLEAEERKRESRIKITDRPPPQKRTRRGWPVGPQTKTLFQKTRTEASRIQKCMYSPRMIPPMPTAKNYSISPNVSSPLLSPPSMKSSNSRVTVTAVRYRRHLNSTVSSKSAPDPVDVAELTISDSKPVEKPNPLSTPIPPSTSQSQPSPTKPPTPKKDPMSSIFMPKHRAHSQLPRQPLANRSSIR